jgi:hypothetical protein
MLLDPPLDPNERFRERRRRARRLRAGRRLAVLGAAAVAAAAVTLGTRPFDGDDGSKLAETLVPAAAEKLPAGDASPAPGAREPAGAPSRPPEEIRGVHVTMTLASVEGTIDELLGLRTLGLNTVELDVKDENGEIGFVAPRVPLAHALGSARDYYDAGSVARRLARADVYLIGRVAVFADPILTAMRPGLAVRTPAGTVWRSAAGLGWANPYDRRVWKYNVDVAEAAVRAGFDEIMFDGVRFPTGAGAVYAGRVREPRAETLERFLRYAAARLRPLGARVSVTVLGSAVESDLGDGQKPRLLARAVDAVYPIVFPSHYRPGELGIADPALRPGRTVARSLEALRHELRGRTAAVVPWLQDFSFGRTQTLADVRAEIAAARAAGTAGFLLWNPSGVYTTDALRAR